MKFNPYQTKQNNKTKSRISFFGQSSRHDEADATNLTKTSSFRQKRSKVANKGPGVEK